MKYTSKNPLINVITLTCVNYDKLIKLTTLVVNKELKTNLTEGEIKEVIDFAFADLID